MSFTVRFFPNYMYYCFSFLVYKIDESWQMAVKANKSTSSGKQVNFLAFLFFVKLFS